MNNKGKYFSLMNMWSSLSILEQDLVFTWLVAAGQFDDDEEKYKLLMDEMRKMKGTFSL